LPDWDTSSRGRLGLRLGLLRFGRLRLGRFHHWNGARHKRLSDALNLGLKAIHVQVRNDKRRSGHCVSNFRRKSGHRRSRANPSQPFKASNRFTHRPNVLNRGLIESPLKLSPLCAAVGVP
jgi:hypothetical protein